MNYSNFDNDITVLKTLGNLIRQYRIASNESQAELALRCGISASTVERIEGGADTKLSNIIKILRAYSLLENLEMLIPDGQTDLKDYFEGKKQRQRASRKQNSTPTEWVWGEDKKGADKS